MELRHLRGFMAVAEELHFARAAERLHIEQSPLSRTIKELESDIGAQLFDRNSRGTRLTKPGEVLAEAVQRIFQAVEQARSDVQAAAAGYHCSLRIALSDGVMPQRLAAVLAQCREQEPEVEIRLFEVSLSQQLKGLREDLFDVGFARSNIVGDGIMAQAVWRTPLSIAVHARHPLLAHKQIPLAELLNYPLVLFHPHTHAGLHKQIESLLQQIPSPTTIAEHVSSHEVMMTLVAAGYGIGLTTEAQMMLCQNVEIVTRPLAGDQPLLTSYLLRPPKEPGETLKRFIARVTDMDQSFQTDESIDTPRLSKS
ncbi:LysR substrate-binding domain-containing protein [Pseudomonas synxantha]|uniref:DNA-binding transcriptional LysR family regulator n=1 Tax=Pseudomonas synxantha TaxID=47883 RepID=A0ACC6JVI4_9PSED|nr:LysR substrate-binding domain-containing protein [Pseudomonas synxantha]MDR6610533.1 DNA-binding transcriptional LysR family regulator [Pseudomonas synxantha]